MAQNSKGQRPKATAYQVTGTAGADDRFPFEYGGNTYTLPAMKRIPLASVEAFEEGRPIRGLLLACDDDDVADALRKMDAEQLNGLVQAWQEHSGISAGE